MLIISLKGIKKTSSKKVMKKLKKIFLPHSWVNMNQIKLIVMFPYFFSGGSDGKASVYNVGDLG